jgi:bifunctional non-homologous end joining protein LigD
VSPAGTEVVTEVEGHRLTLSNLAKVLYPVTGTTKGEVLDYYVRIAPVLLPHIADRAVTRIRWPHGVAKGSFFEKNAPAGAPRWLRTVAVPTTGSRGSGEAGEINFPVVDGIAALVYLANLASLELHVHQWRVDDEGTPRNPDRMVVDLDPGEGAGLPQCCEVALLARSLLAERDLDAKPVTSGSKGLHLYVPLLGELDSDGTTALAKEVAEELQAAHPKLVTATMTKARRTGKVFFDWSQNAGSKTTVAPYSLRGRERPTVATPVTWGEVEAGAGDEFGLEQFRFDEVLARVDEHGDLFG